VDSADILQRLASGCYLTLDDVEDTTLEAVEDMITTLDSTVGLIELPSLATCRLVLTQLLAFHLQFPALAFSFRFRSLHIGKVKAVFMMDFYHLPLYVVVL
jgi:hypothetical protein